MARRRTALALLAAILSSAITFTYLARASETEQVVVAVKSVPAFGLITSQSVRLSAVSRQSIHPTAYRRCEDVIGKYAAQALVEGEQVLRERVAAGQYGGIVAGMSPDLRAMFIPVDSGRTVGGHVRPGGRVDVICVSEGSRVPAISRCVLRSVTVLSVSSGGERTAVGGGDCPGVVVSVTPEDAERLAFCLENGQVYLAAVPFGASVSPTEGVVWGDVFEQAATTNP